MTSLKIVGFVNSPIKELSAAPLQENEGAPAVTIVINEEFVAAISGLRTGDKVVVMTWLHKGDRNTLTTHPRNDLTLPKLGVFATRSPDRPNPIGLHVAIITSVGDDVIAVSNLEAIDGTPVIDIKPYLDR
jgi:tRNA-Thr(GGU) m(6)t(6)A37 methyltransferase TsaA